MRDVETGLRPLTLRGSAIFISANHSTSSSSGIIAISLLKACDGEESQKQNNFDVAKSDIPRMQTLRRN